MAGRNRKKKGNDPFFADESRKRRKPNHDQLEDAEIESDFEEQIEEQDDAEDKSEDDSENEEEVEETGAEARKRIAHDYLKMVREISQKEKEQREEEDSDDEGARDSLVALKLMKDQQEESGRVRRAIASRFASFQFYNP